MRKYVTLFLNSHNFAKKGTNWMGFFSNFLFLNALWIINTKKFKKIFYYEILKFNTVHSTELTVEKFSILEKKKSNLYIRSSKMA